MAPGSREFDSSTEVLRVDGERLLLRARKIEVAVLAGPSSGTTVQLPGVEARIGSGPGNDLLLADPAVSRHHLTLRMDTVGVRAVDEGSRNGTTLDGVRIRDAYVRPDSLIRLGSTTLQLRLLRDIVELPLSSREQLGGVIGKSIPMRQVFTILERVAPGDDTVLIEGETGTGKEMVAEAIHEESLRASRPFVVFDCAAVAEGVLESELFGHVRGAFTGALSDREGVFEAADGGTLFLDELGELPLHLQPKLLRVLERFETRRVGSTSTRRVDVRVIAATNRNLAAEVAAGRFREDLFYRIGVVRIRLPPLRERLEDIPLLVEHLQKQLARPGASATIPERIVRSFQGRAWPGNVRELRNAVARALSLGSGGDAPVEHSNHAAAHASWSGQVDLRVPLKTAKETLADAFERAYIEEALREAGGNVSRAAEIAGVNRKLIQRAMKRHALRGDPDL